MQTVTGLFIRAHEPWVMEINFERKYRAIDELKEYAVNIRCKENCLFPPRALFRVTPARVDFAPEDSLNLVLGWENKTAIKQLWKWQYTKLSEHNGHLFRQKLIIRRQRWHEVCFALLKIFETIVTIEPFIDAHLKRGLLSTCGLLSPRH